MKIAVRSLLLIACILAPVASQAAVEESLVELRRVDKAVLIPSSEMGEVVVYASAVPVSRSSSRFRYSYSVTYREGFPSMVPFSMQAGDGPVPLTAVTIVGDTDCDIQMVATPERHQNGPWSWVSLAGGTLLYQTPSRRWTPDEAPLRFTFTSACAPARGRVVVGMTHGAEWSEAGYGIAAPIVAPMRPPARPRGTSGPAPHGTYANPENRR